MENRFWRAERRERRLEIYMTSKVLSSVLKHLKCLCPCHGSCSWLWPFFCSMELGLKTTHREGQNCLGRSVHHLETGLPFVWDRYKRDNYSVGHVIGLFVHPHAKVIVSVCILQGGVCKYVFPWEKQYGIAISFSLLLYLYLYINKICS